MMLFDFLDFNRDGNLDLTEKWLGLMLLDELMAEEETDDRTGEEENSFSEDD